MSIVISKNTTISHPPPMEMIKAAILASESKKGLSLISIKKYLQITFSIDLVKYSPFLKRALVHAIEKGQLVRVGDKTVGAQGSFKLPSIKAQKLLTKATKVIEAEKKAAKVAEKEANKVPQEKEIVKKVAKKSIKVTAKKVTEKKVTKAASEKVADQKDTKVPTEKKVAVKKVIKKAIEKLVKKTTPLKSTKAKTVSPKKVSKVEVKPKTKSAAQKGGK